MRGLRLLRRAGLPPALLLVAILTLEAPSPAVAATATTRRPSVSSSGEEGNAGSLYPSVSASGRFVAFHAEASNLVTGDTNGTYDVFVRDRKNRTTERVSVSTTGDEGNGTSYFASISDDGRFVAFVSSASNLTGGDTNGVADIFVHDREKHTTKRISVSSDGVQGDASSGEPAISANGRSVAFSSASTTLVANDTNLASDIFVRDRRDRTTKRVSVSTTGIEGNFGASSPSISANGRFVAFESNASNLVGGDTNVVRDIFVRDRETKVTKRVSVSTAGEQGDASSDRPSISDDGRFVAFDSQSSTLVGNDTNGLYDVFVRDRTNRTTKRVSVSTAGEQGNGSSTGASISADGHLVAFASPATNLVGNDGNVQPDVFVRNRTTHRTRRVSVGVTGTEANGPSDGASVSADGRFVAFYSAATNLVENDTNAQYDVFIRGPLS
jgi:hypothetical protein